MRDTALLSVILPAAARRFPVQGNTMKPEGEGEIDGGKQGAKDECMKDTYHLCK